MRIHSVSLVLALMALGTGAVSFLAAADPVVGAGKALQAVTRPSDERVLSFVRPGRMVKILVKEGDLVTPNQLVAEQDSTEEEVQLSAATKEANSEAEINAERMVLESDKEDLRQKSMPNAAAATERREAELKVKVDEARIVLAIEKKEQAAYKVDATKATMEKMKLFVPKDISGIVIDNTLKLGESADVQNMKVVKVVQIDPLYVEVAVPIPQARTLKNGDAARVAFVDSDKKVRPGKVIFISPTGDSASKTIKVRLEVPNPEKLQSGEMVEVMFGQIPVAAAPAGAR